MEENRISPQLFDSGSYWFKQSRHELFEDAHGNFYITPEKDSAPLPGYLPLECFPDILKSFWDIGMAVPRKYFEGNETPLIRYNNLCRDEKISIGKAIVRFANKYGLLGLFRLYIDRIEHKSEIDRSKLDLKTLREKLEQGEQYPIPDDAIKNIDKVMPNPHSEFWENWCKESTFSKKENSLERLSSLDYDDYAKYFFPRNLRPYPNLKLDTSANFLEKGMTDSAYGNFNYIPFSIGYSEPVYLFLYEWERLYRKFQEWQSFANGDFHPDDIGKIDSCGNKYSWAYYLSRILATSPMSVGISYSMHKDKWQLNYNFRTLLDALFLMTLQDITSKHQQVKHCSICNRPFIAKSPKAKHCSTACGTNERVKRHRYKMKNQSIDKREEV